MTNLEIILENFDIVPNDKKLFEQAFTHSSYVHELGIEKGDYERIEFMGDAVLDLAVANLIFKAHKDMPQGIMSKLRSNLVQGTSLAEYARKYDFGKAILVGHGELISGGQNSKKILEDVFEAFIGAVYLDQGYEKAYQIVKKVFLDDIYHFDIEAIQDFKSKLQEDVQSDRRGNVVYRVVKESGTPQDKEFEIEVLYDDIVLGHGKGKNKKQAEQAAARDALSKRAR